MLPLRTREVFRLRKRLMQPSARSNRRPPLETPPCDGLTSKPVEENRRRLEDFPHVRSLLVPRQFAAIPLRGRFRVDFDLNYIRVK
jgi:hypothetical protein